MGLCGLNLRTPTLYCHTFGSMALSKSAILIATRTVLVLLSGDRDINSISVTVIPLLVINSFNCSQVASLDTPEATKLASAASNSSVSPFPVQVAPNTRVDCLLGLLVLPFVDPSFTL